LWRRLKSYGLVAARRRRKNLDILGG